MKQAFQLENELDTDFKAITKAAELIENGDLDPDQVAVLPVGAKERAYAKEMGEPVFYYSESKRKDCLSLEIHKEGLYDMLPEGLFHNPPTGSSGMSEEEMVADVQARRIEERDARRFFMPYEAELNHMRTLLELYENRLDKKTTYDDLTQVFRMGWKEFELMDKEQSVIWMHLLPLIQQKRNDMNFLGQLLSLLFKVPVSVDFQAGATRMKAIEENLQFKLGCGTLGISSVIGSSYADDEDELQLNIGPADTHKLVEFMPGTPQSYLIDLAVSYLVPVNTTVTTNLVATEDQRQGRLGQDSDASFLGYTVYL